MYTPAPKSSFLIVIPHYGSDEHLARLLPSLGAVVPWDAVHRGDRQIAIPYLYGEICIINNNHVNRGFTRACNEGIRYGLEKGYGAVWLLNNDTAVPNLQEAVSSFSREFKENSETGVIGCKMLSFEDADFIHHGGTGVAFPAGVHKSGRVSRGDHSQRTEEEWVTGASMVIASTALRAEGLLDENFFNYGSDSDYCFRARKSGFRVVYLPVPILHAIGQSANPSALQRTVMERDMEYFRKKWHSVPMKKVHVILRTHSGPTVHGGQRVLDIPKSELISGCLRSLLHTLSEVDRTRYTLQLTVLDDHSDGLCIERIHELIQSTSFPATFVPLSVRGVGPSFGASYACARDTEADIVYFVEDDYLHAPSALPEMLEAQEVFSENLGGQEVAIFPVDYPDNYNPRWMKPSYLVMGPRRHWHTDFSTTGTFLISRPAFLKNFDLCMRMSRYMSDPEVTEATSLNIIWQERGVQLFSPVPTLAIHMQTKECVPPFTDVHEWWKQYASP